jgi:Mrp family chromosome partitioning ATPase
LLQPLHWQKVLLIGMDIRNPKLGAYLDIPERGLTNSIQGFENTGFDCEV